MFKQIGTFLKGMFGKAKDRGQKAKYEGKVKFKAEKDDKKADEHRSKHGFSQSEKGYSKNRLKRRRRKKELKKRRRQRKSNIKRGV